MPSSGNRSVFPRLTSRPRGSQRLCSCSRSWSVPPNCPHSGAAKSRAASREEREGVFVSRISPATSCVRVWRG